MQSTLGIGAEDILSGPWLIAGTSTTSQLGIRAARISFHHTRSLIRAVMMSSKPMCPGSGPCGM